LEDGATKEIALSELVHPQATPQPSQETDRA
jgi:hypothetical protein